MSAIPDLCPICGATKSHDAVSVGPLQGRVYVCGAGFCTDHDGKIHQAIVCPKTLDLLAHLRADNVLLAVAMQGAVDDLELALRAWATLPLDSLPKTALLELAPLRAAYDELVDVLEGAAPTPAAEAAPAEPVRGQADLELASAAEHVGERSCSSQ